MVLGVANGIAIYTYFRRFIWSKKNANAQCGMESNAKIIIAERIFFVAPLEQNPLPYERNSAKAFFPKTNIWFGSRLG
ncbi:MAG: hypothetical protein ACJAU0_001063 [Flavobacteriales bacterium]|jgi:hypothetical protein